MTSTTVAPNEATDPTVVVVRPRTADDSGLAATGAERPLLSWRLRTDRSAVVQSAYELETAADEDFRDPLERTGAVESACQETAMPGRALGSREVRWWRVRVRTDRGWTAWSEASRVEAALLEAADWTARPIALPSDAGRVEPGPAPMFRREIDLDGPVAAARLYVTALGVHDMRVNGRPVAPDLLEPGWTPYGKRLLYATYDVAGLLRSGANVLTATVGDGWYRGTLTWAGRRALYGDTLALLAQLEVALTDGSRVTVGTDGEWKATTGEVTSAGLYEGATVDLRRRRDGMHLPGYDDGDWEAARPLDLPPRLEQRSAPPVRAVQVRPVDFAPGPEGALRVDTGQNLTGYLRLTVEGEAGRRVTVRHAEVLDAEGSLHTEPLRLAEATDRYTLADARAETLEPPFTFHGFRYADIEVDPGVRVTGVEAVVVASDLERTGRFACSDERVNRLYENVVWSQRGNFLAVPTDCPQRDERLGWTGDLQVFAPTACHNFDGRAFLRSWLRDLAAEQRDDGCVPHVVPDVLGVFDDEDLRYGSTGWADAAVTVPWALYEAYGDETILADQYDSMRRWVDWGATQLDDDGIWSGGFHFGDWLDPNGSSERPGESTTPTPFTATSYLAHSARLTARAARVLGHEADAEHYESLGDRAAEAAWSRFKDTALATQTGCSLALEFAIAPPAERAETAAALAALVRAADGRIATGFLGTPLVLHALTASGHHEEAYRLLLNERSPGWLHQLRHGATTVWERWDAIGEDGRVHGGTMDASGPMVSFNHYAYGAVASWLYRTVAGIAPDAEAPGYERVVFAPVPGGGLAWAAAMMDTPRGEASIRWETEGSVVDAEVLVPPGSTGTFVLPPGRWEDVRVDGAPVAQAALVPSEVYGRPALKLGAGGHRLELT
ncbi:glycoside hydrolase family 78 protein [Glycomyces halotolerans]